MLFPIVIPQIDWPRYLSSASQILGESISSDFDGAMLPPSPKAFVISTNTLNETQPPLDIDTAGLRHLSYSFLTVMLEGAHHALLEVVPLAFTSSQSARPGIRLCLVSGTLLQWKEAVVLCSGSSNQDVKLFGQEAKAYFDSIGLSDMWKHYLRIQLPDKTLKLVHKP